MTNFVLCGKDFEILDLDPPNNPTTHYGACHFGYNLALRNIRMQDNCYMYRLGVTLINNCIIVDVCVALISLPALFLICHEHTLIIFHRGLEQLDFHPKSKFPGEG